MLRERRRRIAARVAALLLSAVAAAARAEAQESAPASRPESDPASRAESRAESEPFEPTRLDVGILKGASKDWTNSFEGGDGHTDRVYIIGSRMRIEVAPVESWRLSAGLGWDTYINSDHIRDDLYPSLGARYLPDQDQEYEARVDYHVFMEASQAPTGLLLGRFQFADGSFLFARAARDVVQDSLLSAVGENTAQGKGGQVRSNVVTAGFAWIPASDWDLHAGGGGGVYDGLLTPDNSMWTANGGASLVVQREDPWLRFGYEALAYGFEKDASGFFNVTNPANVYPGGYFSPQFYLLQQIRADAAWQLNETFRLSTGGGAGPEIVRSKTQDPSDWHWGIDAHVRVEAQFVPEARAYLGYIYRNEGAADHQSVITFGAEVRF